MVFKTLITNEENSIFTVTLNRPEKRNAISYELIDDLLRALAMAEKSAAQVLIITGSGKAFCAGMDLDNLKALSGANKTHVEHVEDSRTMARLFRQLYDFPKPSIAAVNGAAIAGGTGIATLCDITIAIPEAKFGYTEVRIGFVPAIVSTFLMRQVGEKQARDLLLTGRLIDASEAFRIGLINEIVAGENLMTRAHEIAALLLGNSPASVRATKELLSKNVNTELDQQIEAAVEQNARMRLTEDFREGVASFLEKRKPKWSGQ
jgi:methylglutaconyl-CoA hydratase